MKFLKKQKEIFIMNYYENLSKYIFDRKFLINEQRKKKQNKGKRNKQKKQNKKRQMDYFFSRVGRGIRYSATIVGGIACGVIIILSVIGIQTIIVPICGGIALIPIGMVLFENIKIIKDLEKLVTKFKNQLQELGLINNNLSDNVSRLSTEVSQLSQTKDSLIKETTKLSDLLKEAETKVVKLSDLAKTYEDNATQLSLLTQDYKNQNQQLTDETNKLVDIKKQYEEENTRLMVTIDKINQQLSQLTQIKEAHEAELLKSEHNNQALKTEIEKIATYYNQAKEVIETLLRSKNVLDDIYSGMIKTETQTSENVTTMSKLLNIFGKSRTMELFQQLDEDGDGVLTSQEFINALSKNDEKV